ncbi:MAG TPA: PilN domain-containing protein [Magnetospirillaceae bacterium]|jgi:general secretion pathway protein L
MSNTLPIASSSQAGLALARRALAEGWQWWRDEIQAMLPARMRRLFQRDRSCAVLIAGDTGIALRLPGDTTALPLVDGPWARGIDTAILAQATARLHKTGVDRHPLRLSLMTDAILRTTLTLPAAVEENLDEVLHFELDRRTPFAAADARFAYRIAKRDRPANQIQVELAVVRHQIVAQAVAAAARLGLAVDILDLSPAAGAGDLTVSLKDDADDEAGTSWRRRLRRWAPAIVLVALLIALGAPALRSHHQIAELRAEVAAARADAMKAAQLEDELAQRTAGAAFMTARKRANAGALQILAEMTRQIPDGTWLEDFSLSDKDVKLIGYSNSSSALIPLLTKSVLITAPHFESPVTIDSATGHERFEISARRATKAGPTP